MKKCPFCAEEIQNDAVYCRHCKNHLDDAPTISRKESKGKLKEFETFMASYGGGWLLIGKSNEMISYQKVTTGSKGSCLVALILFCLGIIPGILYLWFANQPGGTYHLAVTLNPNGDLIPSGDSSGMSIFNSFLKSQKNPGKVITAPVKPWYLQWWAILMWIIVFFMIIGIISAAFSPSANNSANNNEKEAKVLWDIPNLMNKSHNQIVKILGNPSMIEKLSDGKIEGFKFVNNKMQRFFEEDKPARRGMKVTVYQIYYMKSVCEMMVCGNDLTYSYVDPDKPIKYFSISNYPVAQPSSSINDLEQMGNVLNNTSLKIVPEESYVSTNAAGIDICEKGYRGSEYEDGSENCLK